MSQQYLPFTVLKLVKKYTTHFSIDSRLSQQYLPFTVLKLNYVLFPFLCLYVKSQQYLPFTVLKLLPLLILLTSS